MLDEGTRAQVAWSRKTPAADLVRLAGDPAQQVRLAVAENPAAPLAALQRLARDEDLRVRLELARRTDLPEAVAATLAEDTCAAVRAQRAQYGATDLDRLAGDGAPEVRRALLSNELATEEVLAALWTDRALAEWVARCPRAPAARLRSLARSKREALRCSVARNPATPAKVLGKLAEDDSPRVRVGVARNRAAPLEVLLQLARAPDAGYTEYAMGDIWGDSTHEALLDRAAPPELLEVLGDGEGPLAAEARLALHGPSAERLAATPWQRRAACARDPETEADVLRVLAEDPEPFVRADVAANEGAPAEVLLALFEANRRDSRVMECLAGNRATPVSILEALAQRDPLPTALLLNYALPVAIQWRFARHPEPTMRAAVADRLGTDAEVLAVLATDEDLRVRLQTASNNRTPGEALAKLAGDRDKRVRQAAAGRLLLPRACLDALARDRATAVRLVTARRVDLNEAQRGRLLADRDPEVRATAAQAEASRSSTISTAALPQEHQAPPKVN